MKSGMHIFSFTDFVERDSGIWYDSYDYYENTGMHVKKEEICSN